MITLRFSIDNWVIRTTQQLQENEKHELAMKLE